MSDRIEFYEVRKGTPDNWDHICLCKDEDTATEIASFMFRVKQENNLLVIEEDFFVEHVEIKATIDLEISEW